jgi:hypothetical protein
MNETSGVVLDKQVPGAAGAHALIVGIDEYPHLTNSQFGHFPRLTSAVASAVTFYDWLLNRARLPVPLATCRLLMSPALDGPPVLAPHGVLPATTDEFLKAAWGWRSAATMSSEGMAIFFFCGHRLQVSREEDIFLFQNFGEPYGPTFRGAVSFVNLFNGMEAHENPMARTQLFLLDGSRHPYTRASLGERLYGTTDVFDVFPSGPDRRVAGVFQAAAPGEQAYSMAREPSLFTKALIEGLEGRAAVHQRSPSPTAGGWVVTTTSLANWMSNETQRLADEHKVPVTFRASAIGDGVVAKIDEAPMVQLDVLIEPAEAAKGAQLTVEDQHGKIVAQFSDPAPRLKMQLAAGFYALSCMKEGAPGVTRQLISATPESVAAGPVVLDLSP